LLPQKEEPFASYRSPASRSGTEGKQESPVAGIMPWKRIEIIF